MAMHVWTFRKISSFERVTVITRKVCIRCEIKTMLNRSHGCRMFPPLISVERTSQIHTNAIHASYTGYVEHCPKFNRDNTLLSITQNLSGYSFSTWKKQKKTETRTSVIKLSLTCQPNS